MKVITMITGSKNQVARMGEKSYALELVTWTDNLLCIHNYLLNFKNNLKVKL